MGNRGGFARELSRDVGGMPIWALVVFVLALVGAVAFASTTDRPEPAAFVAPTDAATPAVPAPMPLVVFLGDSYTQGIGGEGVNWPELVGTDNDWDVANLGLGGTGYLTTSDENGCGRAYCGTYAEASAEIIGSPRMIFISGGRNDLGIATEDIAEAAGALIDDLRDRFPSAVVVLVNPWQDDDAPPRQFGELGPALEKAADEHEAFYLDTGQPLAGKESLVAEDGIHPNAKGYRALAAAVEKALTDANLL